MSQTDSIDTTAPEDAYDIRRDILDAVDAALVARDRGALIAALDTLHPADIADIIEQISPSERRDLVDLWGRDFDGDVLSELDDGLREDVLEVMHRDTLQEAVRDLETDDVVDLVEDLEAHQADQILSALDEGDRAAVTSSLQYPEDSAGRLMQRELAMAPEHWTVGQAIDNMRGSDDLPEQFYHIVLVDPRMRPTGQVQLGRLMSAPRDTDLSDIVEEDFRTIPVLQSQEDVAYAFNQYHLVSAPVVDEDGRLVGVITIDDAMAVLDEEAEEDLLLLAGVGGDESISDKVPEIVRARFTWLFVNLVTAIIASFVIAHFSDTIQSMVALAVLMPIVASMGGNAGTQSMTVAVRALATRDLTGANAWRVIRREVLIGLLNGLGFAALMAAVAVFWFGLPQLALVVALAMVMTLVAAALGGILIPLGLDKLGVDPALASGPFVTTVTDVIGFLSFLGLAAALIL